MMRLVRRGAVVAVALAGALFTSGCGSESSCGINPPLHYYPRSCSLRAGSTVTVNLETCNCGSTVVCEVTEQDGFYTLEPRVTACDADCPGNPTSCDLDSSVSCVFNTPALGSDPSLEVNIADGSVVRNVTYTLSATGDLDCL